MSQASTTTGPAAPPDRTVAPRVIETLRRATAILHGDLRRVLIVNLVFLVLFAALNTAALLFVMNYLVARLEWTYRADTQNALLSFLTLPFVAYLVTGLLRFYAGIARGEKPAWFVLLRFHPTYFHMLFFWCAYYVLYYFLVKVAVRGLVEPFRYENEILARMAAGFLFFLWICVRLMFAPLYLMEQARTLREAARRSWMLTSGRSRRTAWFVFLMLILTGAGTAFLGVGILYTFGLAMIAYVLYFDRLSHPESQRP